MPLLMRLTSLEVLADGLAEITKLPWEPISEPPLEEQTQTPANNLEQDAETKVVNSILNLRHIATVEWKDFFEATSLVERNLRLDPAGVYSQSDFETRNYYRGVVEELARLREAGDRDRRYLSSWPLRGHSCERHIGLPGRQDGRNEQICSSGAA